MTTINTNCHNAGSVGTSLVVTPNGDNFDVTFSSTQIGDGVPLDLKFYDAAGAEPTDAAVIASPDQTEPFDATFTITQALADGDWKLKVVPRNGLTGTGIVSNTFTVASAYSFTDDFNRANEAMDASANWQTATANTINNVSSNQLVPTQTSLSGGVHPRALTGDCYAQAENVVGGAGDMCLFLHWQDSSNYYYARWRDNFAISINRVVADVTTSWAGTNQFPTAGMVMKFEREGNDLVIYFDDVENVRQTDTTFTGGYAGLGSRGNGGDGSHASDNFACGELA